MASEAFAGVGTKFQRWDGAAWQDIAEVNSIDGPGMTKDVLEVTSLDTDAGYNEFITGFAEGGTLTLDMNFTRETYELMKEDFESDEVRSYRIQLPDYDLAPSTFTIEGLVIELPITMTADDKVTADVVIQITSQVILDDGISWSTYWTALKAAMTNKPSQAYSIAANTFITSLVDGGVWAKLDRLFVFAAETNDGGEALLDWIHPTGTPAILAYGSGGSVPTFTANKGFKGNVANKAYIDTKYNPTLHAVNYTQNSASMGCYINELSTGTGNHLMGGVAGINYLSPRYNNGQFRCNVNGAVDWTAQTMLSTPSLVSVVRSNATTVTAYIGTTALAAKTINSAAIGNHEITILTITTAYDNSEVSMAYIGAGLTEADITVLKNAWDAFFLT